MVFDRQVPGGLARIGDGAAIIGLGAEILTDRQVLSAVAAIGLGVAVIGFGAAAIGPGAMVSGLRQFVDSLTKAPPSQEISQMRPKAATFLKKVQTRALTGPVCKPSASPSVVRI